MSEKRTSISKKIRFEVFKRDKFTCQYCGQCAPQVVLQWLEAAKSWGATIQELKDIALTVRNWTQFSERISEIIEKYKALDEL